MGRHCLGRGVGWQEATAELQGPVPTAVPCPEPVALLPSPQCCSGACCGPY